MSQSIGGSSGSIGGGRRERPRTGWPARGQGPRHVAADEAAGARHQDGPVARGRGRVNGRRASAGSGRAARGRGTSAACPVEARQAERDELAVDRGRA